MVNTLVLFATLCAVDHVKILGDMGSARTFSERDNVGMLKCSIRVQ